MGTLPASGTLARPLIPRVVCCSVMIACQLLVNWTRLDRGPAQATEVVKLCVVVSVANAKTYGWVGERKASVSSLMATSVELRESRR